MEKLISDDKREVSKTSSHVPYWIIFISGMIATLLLLIGGISLGLFSFKDIYNCKVTPLEDNQTTKSDEVQSKNVVWKIYENESLGFSLQIPQTSQTVFGSCVWTETNNDHSYRPQAATVPVKVFEDLSNNSVYLSMEYYYKLEGRTSEDGHTYFSQCNKVNNSLEILKSDSGEVDSWKIVGQDVNSDSELTAFIKEQYGQGCSLGEKVTTDQTGVFDVTVDNGGVDTLDEQIANDCILNYIYVLKYYPQGYKVVSWNVGQSVKFFEKYPEKSLDNKMIESFKFLEVK